MGRIFIPLYRFLKKNKALMYFLMIASSLVFIYFGTKVVFIEDITKLIDRCEVTGIACHIEFVPIKKQKESEVQGE